MPQTAHTSTSLLDSPKLGWVDRVASVFHNKAGAVLNSEPTGKRIKSLLNGVPIRHRLHPALVDVPVGAWTTALYLDGLAMLTGGKRRKQFETGADAAVVLGIIGSLPAAASGTADWVDVYGKPQRYGMVHAMLNTVALASYGVSFLARRGDQRNQTLALASAGVGFLAMSVSATIGGDLAYNLGVNVPRRPALDPPADYTPVLDSDELAPGEQRMVEIDAFPILLLREEDGSIHALQHWCPHAGAPLSSDGEAGEGVITCHWHGSQFCIEDGRPLRGPASVPLPVFNVKEENGRILVGPQA